MAVDDEALATYRAQFLDLISAYSEDRWCAGWMSGIDEEVRRIGGPWLVLAAGAGGWPKGHRAEGGWEPLDADERAAVAAMTDQPPVATADEREQWAALAEADTLLMLPPEALVASVKDLAGRLLELTSGEVHVHEGWWHPNVTRGIVHDHKPNQPATMHRLCEAVYTRRPVR